MRFDFIVSAENHPYMGWQAMLFHYSCRKHMGRIPIVVVHGDEEALAPSFEYLRSVGGRVQRAPNYRHHGAEYAPRNTAGTLASVRSDADYLVLCDADMLFLRPMPLECLALQENQISFEWAAYLQVFDGNESELREACDRLDVCFETLRCRATPGGVPHVIPAKWRASLSREWLRCLEPFCASTRPDPTVNWLATMWALVLAVHRLELEPVLTRFGTTNYTGSRTDAKPSLDAAVMHYCYGDDEFNKRRFTTGEDADSRVWQSIARPDSVHAAICTQLREAGAYFGLL